MKPLKFVFGSDLFGGTLAKDQPEYQALGYVSLALSQLHAAIAKDIAEGRKYSLEDIMRATTGASDDPQKAIVTRWEFDDDDRRRIAEGQDLYLSILTFGQQVQPVFLQVATAEEILMPPISAEVAAETNKAAADAPPEMMWEVGIESDEFNPHPRDENCEAKKCRPMRK